MACPDTGGDDIDADAAEAVFTSALPRATCTWIERNGSPGGCS
ncbi:hypothetical protein ACFU8W_41815 [Streptomyces sp. NPDC057565]